MNIILFSPEEVELPLPQRDPRAVHLLKVLRRQPGDTFDAGIINGPRGKGTLVAAGAASLKLTFAWGPPPPPADPLHVLVGLPRPQTARDILRDATTLGVAALHFVRTEKGDANYGSSSLWRSGEWIDHAIAGAAQAFCTRLPAITHGLSLAEAIAALPAPGGAITATRARPKESAAGIAPSLPARLALDNYEAKIALPSAGLAPASSVALALGAERGWSDGERTLLRDHGFTFVHLGPRVLRTETACTAAVTLVKARRGWL